VLGKSEKICNPSAGFLITDRPGIHKYMSRGLVMRVHLKSAWKAAAILSGATLILATDPPAVARVADAPTKTDARMLPTFVSGDEPVVVTDHHVETPHGPLHYEARTGRLAIRSEETGEVRGYIFFVAYAVKSKGPPRPITFAWNGGPTVLQSRATDDTGMVQPSRATFIAERSLRGQYHFNAVQSWRIDEKGEAANVYA